MVGCLVMKKEYVYCIHCGQENEVERATCLKCGKLLDAKESLFVDYLLSKTKDGLKDEVSGNIYEIIKNFLLSHLFGMLLLVSLVFVGAVAAYTHDGYIVDRDHQSVVPSQNDVVVDEFMEEKQEASECGIAYLKFALMYDSTDDIVPSSDSMVHDNKYAYMFTSYQGVHQVSFISFNGANTENYHRSDAVYNPKNPSTSLAKQLMHDGYNVCEVEVELVRSVYDTKEVVSTHRFLLIMVEVNGSWLVAEDYVL